MKFYSNIFLLLMITFLGTGCFTNNSKSKDNTEILEENTSFSKYIKLTPINIEKITGDINLPINLFDKNVSTGISYTISSSYRLLYNNDRILKTVKIYGNSNYLLKIFRDKEATPIFEQNLSKNSSEIWNSFSLSDEYFVKDLVVELSPLTLEENAELSSIKEIEFWFEDECTTYSLDNSASIAVARSSKSINDLKDSIGLTESNGFVSEFYNADTVSIKDDILSIVSDTDTTGKANITFDIDFNPSLYNRAVLTYKAKGFYAFFNVGREINGHGKREAVTADYEKFDSEQWYEITEEIDPTLLNQGENILTIYSDDNVKIKEMNLVLLQDNGLTAMASISDSRAFDLDTETCYTMKDTDDSLTVEFERQSDVDYVLINTDENFNMDNVTFEYVGDSGWEAFTVTASDDIKAGWNRFKVNEDIATSSVRLCFGGTSSSKTVVINEVRFSASPVVYTEAPELTVTYPLNGEYYGSEAVVCGFIKNLDSTVTVYSANESSKVINDDGSFAIKENRGENRDTTVAAKDMTSYVSSYVKYTKNMNSNDDGSGTGDGNSESSDSDSDSETVSSADKFETMVYADSDQSITYRGVTLDIPAGAVSKTTKFTIIPLYSGDINNLNYGMKNVTYPASGYRFLPSGTFEKYITVRFQYDPTVLSSGQKDEDVYMYYYNTEATLWQKLDRVGVDKNNTEVVSKTNHFTDIINATLTVPDHPDPLTSNPNSIKDMTAANPASKVNLAEVSPAGNRGDLSANYPIEIPAGRKGVQPNIAISYNSGGNGGWLGMGWNIQSDQITIDTRWGVPRYDGSEIFLLNGSRLEKTGSDSIGDIYRPQIEGSFSRIRKITESDSVYWEITDKQGTKYYYGQSENSKFRSNRLINKKYPVFRWYLEKVEDTNGNNIIYEYAGDSVGGLVVDKYLSGIYYTGYSNSKGAYSIEFILDSVTIREDVDLSYRSGFKILNRKLLKTINVKYKNALIRGYDLSYVKGKFSKTLLNSIKQKDMSGKYFPGNIHEFEYYNDLGDGYDGFSQTAVDFENEKKMDFQSILNFLSWFSNNKASISNSSGDDKYIGLYAGFSPFNWFKDYAIGGNYTKNWSDSTTKLKLMDINGDGIVDQVFDSGSTISYKSGKNEDGKIVFSSQKIIKNFSALDHEETEGRTKGVSATAFGSGVASECSNSETLSQSYFADVNGDGAVDFIKSGSVLYNWLAYGLDEFRSDSPVPFKTGGSYSVNTDDEEIVREQLVKEYYLDEPVRMWRAPYGGKININGTVKLIGKPESENERYLTDDGVRVIVQHNDTVLIDERIEAENREAVDLNEDGMLNNITVKANDEIYFRVNSFDDGSYDEVEWKPIIKYVKDSVVYVSEFESSESSTIVSSDQIIVDENNRNILNYSSENDFLIAGANGGWTSYKNGTIAFTGKVVKNKITTDDINFRITKTTERQVTINKKLYTQMQTEIVHSAIIDADDTGELEFYDIFPDTLSVDSNEMITCEFYSNTPIDWKGIKIDSTVHYNDEENPVEMKIFPFINIFQPYGSEEIKQEVYEANQYTGQFGVVEYYVDMEQKNVLPYVVKEDKENLRVIWSFGVKGNNPTGNTKYFDTDYDYFYGNERYTQLLNPNILETAWEYNDAVDPDVFGDDYVANIEFTVKCKKQDGSIITLARSENQVLSKGVKVLYLDANFENLEKGDLLYFICTSDRDDFVKYIELSDSYFPAPVFYDPLEVDEVQVIPSDQYSDYDYGSAHIKTVWNPYDEDRETGQGVFYHLKKKSEFFSGGYRNWYFARRRGNSIEMKKNDLQYDESLFGEDGEPKNTYSEDEGDAISESLKDASPMVLGTIDDSECWLGNDQDTWITATGMSSTRVSRKYIPSGSGGEDSYFPGIFNGIEKKTKSDSKTTSMDILGEKIVLSSGDSNTYSDYFDFNGDGYPDFIYKNKVQLTNGYDSGALDDKVIDLDFGYVRQSSNSNTSYCLGKPSIPVTLNSADGIPKGQDNVNGSMLGGNFGYGDTDTKKQFTDVNGDGLPDLLYCVTDPNRVMVRYNMGDAFSEPEILYTGSYISRYKTGNAGISGGFSVDSDGYGGGILTSVSQSGTASTFIDINGDGLADILKKNIDFDNDVVSLIKGGSDIFNGMIGSENLKVRLNTGKGFAAEIDWIGSPKSIPISAEASLIDKANVSYSYKYPLWWPFPPVFLGSLIVNPSAGKGKNQSQSAVTMQDVNGDGLVDHVYSDAKGNLMVWLNNTGRTNLLKKVTRPLGSEIETEYERAGNTVKMGQSKWVVKTITVKDGSGSTADGHILTTEYKYTDGEYDRTRRQFTGFGTVVAKSADDTYSITKYYTDYYYQGLQKEMAVKVMDSNLDLNDEDDLADILTTTGDIKGKIYSRVYNEYGERTAIDVNKNVNFTYLWKKTSTQYEGISTLSITKEEEYTYDDYGNVTVYNDRGDTTIITDDVTAKISYKEATGISDSYQVSLPLAIYVYEGELNGTLLRKRTATYDSKGNLVELNVWNGSKSIETGILYDSYGNMRTLVGPTDDNGQRYIINYSYDDQVNTYVVQTKDSFGYTSKAVYDYKWGALTKTIDINKNVMTYRYDTKGRLDSVYGPYDQNTSDPTVDFIYYTDRYPATAITLKEGITTVIYVDGLQRLLQTKKNAEINGNSAMVASGAIEYNNMGLVKRQGQPIEMSSSYSYSVSAMKNPTIMYYDKLGRNVGLIFPDGSEIKTGYYIEHGMHRTRIDDNNGIFKAIYKDVDGMVKKVAKIDGSQFISTLYQYDSLNQITKVTDAKGNTTTVTYDKLGRRTAVENPDTGLVEYVYDSVGHLVRKITPNTRKIGKYIEYVYKLNRLYRIIYPEGNNVVYTYGDPGSTYKRAGKIYKVENDQCKEEYRYGKMGELTRKDLYIKHTIPTVETKQYTMEYSFDNLGRMQSMTYPDGEVVRYYYKAGRLKSVRGSKDGEVTTYVKDILYDEFDQRTKMEMGNGVINEYTYDYTTRHLSHLKSYKGDKIYQNISYKFDKVGNLLERVNKDFVTTGTVKKTSTQTYSYDNLYRLTGSTGEYTKESWLPYFNDRTNTYTNKVSYDIVGKITHKSMDNKGIYPELGNDVRTLTDTTYDRDYSYAGAQPHAVTTAGELNMTYDSNGNMLIKEWSDKSVKLAMTWDSENRMLSSKSINENTGATVNTTYKYGPDGRRVLKTGPYGEAVYVDANYTVRNGTVVGKHIFAGSQRIVSKVTDTSGDKTDTGTFYQSTDHLGSTNILTDANGDFYEHVESFADGGVWVKEGTKNSNLPFRFTSHEKDPETNFFYAQARYYDAQLSKFISVDPALGEYLPTGDKENDSNLSGMGGFYNPANIDMYSYGVNNPVKYIDPDGKRVVLWSRRLNFKMGSVGVHTFIEIIPDNPKDFNGKTRWTLSGFGSDGAGGQLVTQIDLPDDLNWDQNDTKGNWVVPAPNGKTDTKFINDIMISYNRYQSGSRNYAPFPDINQNEGNCNTVSTGILVGAGVPLNFYDNINPNGFNPGLGEPLPEMVNPVQNNQNNNGNQNRSNNTNGFQFPRGDPSFSGDPSLQP